MYYYFLFTNVRQIVDSGRNTGYYNNNRLITEMSAREFIPTTSCTLVQLRPTDCCGGLTV